MGMKFTERLLRFGLIVMIGVSLYLSYLIWLNPSARNNLHETGDQNVANAEKLSRANNVFLPMRLTWVEGSEVKQNTSEAFISEIQKAAATGDFGTAATKTYDSEEQFQKSCDIADGIELSYFGPFLLAEYAQAFGLDLELGRVGGGRELYFTKVQFDFQRNKLRFLNSRRHQITEADSVVDEAKLSSLIKAEKDNWMVMTAADQLNNMQFNTQDSIKMKQYSYIATNLSYSLFRDAFFTNPQDVKTNEESADLVLYDGSENLTVAEEKQTIDFHGRLILDDETKDIYSQSFQYISKLGNSLGSLRFFDRTKDQINYRIFVEGYPVFADDYQSEVNFTVTNDNNEQELPVHIQTNLNSIQVPIPADETKELPPSQTILDQLREHHVEENLIGAIVIGYERQTIDSASGVVDLIPMWYIRYDSEWYSFDELMKKLQTGEAN